MDRFPDVMILAAGPGTRMRPLTEVMPKPLLDVAGKPLLDRVVGLAHAEGAQRFVVSIHHHADRMKPHIAALDASLGGTRFRLSLEPELLGTGGGVRAALPLLDTDPVLVLQTDGLWLRDDRPLTRMIEAYRGEPRLLCAHPRLSSGFSRKSHDFCLAPNGQITPDFGAQVFFAGAALLPRAVIETAPEGAFSLFDLFEKAMQDGTLHGTVLGSHWLAIGDPEALAAASERLVR